MSLPPELLQAVSAPGGGKITLIVGAGCSLEAPTSIPLAGTCSQQCHDRLVANGILADGDCQMPWDLSNLADAVFTKTGHQQLLVEQLSQHYALKAATPNEGHLLTAALLQERAIASVLTLNFDLALSIAIAQLGVGDSVGIIEGPDDIPSQKVVNLYYLHRNANAADPETWILRTIALENDWRGNWEAVVAAKVLTTPVVVFAGLGSPASVLIESSKLIKNAIPNGSRAYQIDPGEPDESAFFRALDLDPAFFVQTPWCDFMAALSQRLVEEQARQLEAAAAALIRDDFLTAEDITALLDRLREIGLLQLGRLRANWLLQDKPYVPDNPMARPLIADLLLAAALITRVTGATAVLFEDGIVQFQKGDRTVASLVFVSGCGSRSLVAIETELSSRRRRFRGLAKPPTGAIVAGIRDYGAAPITPPADLVLGDVTASIVYGPAELPIFHVESLRQGPEQCHQVAP